MKSVMKIVHRIRTAASNRTVEASRTDDLTALRGRSYMFRRLLDHRYLWLPLQLQQECQKMSCECILGSRLRFKSNDVMEFI